MNLFFDEMSQKLLIMAKKEMYDLKHPYVGSEHLFLAILKNKDLDITKSLNDFGIYYDNFKNELISAVGIGSQSNEWFLFTPLLRNILKQATYYSKDSNGMVTPYSLLISILQNGDGVANRILLSMNIDVELLYEKFLDYSSTNGSKKLLLDEYAINMIDEAKMGKYDPVIGRDKEIDSLIRVLMRKNKNNPLLIGEAGVGKTAIVEELARRIFTGNVPRKIKNYIIYNLPLSVLISGTKYRGEFEEKINNIIDEVKSNPNIILFVDEVHMIIGAGGAEGAIDASNILKPYLARGDLKLIGATTIHEYSLSIAKDKAFDRRFQKIFIDELDREEILNILLELKPLYEEFHNIIITDEIINSIIDFSNNCIHNGKQPDKAIDLLDEVCAYTGSLYSKRELTINEYENQLIKIEKEKNSEIINNNFKRALELRSEENLIRDNYTNYILKKNTTRKKVKVDYIYKVLSIRYDIPVSIDAKKRNLKGNNKFVKNIINIINKWDFINNKVPLSILLLPISDFKIQNMVEETVKNIFSEKCFIKIDLSDYSSEHSIYKIIGSPPGYVGYNDEVNYFNRCFNNMFCIFLLENIDKCNKRIFDLFYKILKEGYFINSKNEKIYFDQSIIFITYSSNEFELGFINTEGNCFEENLEKVVSEVVKIENTIKV